MSVRSPDVDSPIRKDSRSSNGSKDTGMSTGESETFVRHVFLHSRFSCLLVNMSGS